MKIIKFKKSKSNTFEVFFDDNSSTNLYDDVIVKYNLLVNRILDEKKFEEIFLYNEFLEKYYKSIKYINKKMRTEIEIRKFLSKNSTNEEDIEKIIDLLYKDNYLNKERYLEAFVNDQYNLTLNGPLKIQKDLINLGYEKDEINNSLYRLEWNSRIDKLINKKIKNNSKLSNNNLKNKLLNDIIKLGYEKEIILEYLEKLNLDSDEENLKKEFDKIIKKYSAKYKDKELEFKLINYLYRKGYNIEDIKRCYNNYEK